MIARGNFALALFCIAALAAGEPGREDWEEGRRLYGIEDYKRAQKSLERAVSKDPGSSTYHYWLGLAMGRRAEGMTGIWPLPGHGSGEEGEGAFRTRRGTGRFES